MISLWAAINVDMVKNGALGLSGASVLIGLVMLKVMSSVIGKIVSIAFFLAIAMAAYSQSSAITDCANAVKAQAQTSANVNTTCTFFGQEITVKVAIPK